MRVISFTTPQADRGAVRVLTTHQLAGIAQSQSVKEGIQAQISQLHHHMTATPPHTPALARQILEQYAEGLDCAILAHTEHTVTLGTNGTGIIFLKRSGTLSELVADSACAQGPIHEGDEFILTTEELLDLIGGLEGLSYYFLRYSSAEVVEMMKTYEDHSTACGFVVVTFGKPQQPISIPASSEEVGGAQVQDDHYPEEAIEMQTDGSDQIDTQSNVATNPPSKHMQNPIIRIVSQMRTRLASLGLKRLLLILLPTAFLVYLAVTNVDTIVNTSQKKAEYIQTVRESVDATLKSAETEAFVNMKGVEGLLTEARTKIKSMPEKDQERYTEQIAEMNKLINAKEKELLRVSDIPVTEYFGVTVDAEGAQVSDADSNGINLYLLDNKQGLVYVVDGVTRAYSTLKSDKLKGALAVTATEQYVYVLTAKDGIYLLGKDSSVQVIKPDKEWGTITDIKSYTGNIYVLDSQRKNIYKYPGADEKTFGVATAYLVDELQGTLSSNDRFTIDGSVYASGSTKILKFTTGRKSDFNMVLPYEKVDITAIYSDPDLDKLYIYDDVHKALLELTKEGIFERQWKMGDAVVGIGANSEHKTIFAVTRQKVYEIDLP